MYLSKKEIHLVLQQLYRMRQKKKILQSHFSLKWCWKVMMLTFDACQHIWTSICVFKRKAFKYK